jgi:hypothetical protein
VGKFVVAPAAEAEFKLADDAELLVGARPASELFANELPENEAPFQLLPAAGPGYAGVFAEAGLAEVLEAGLWMILLLRGADPTAGTDELETPSVLG